ncbi:hypothetical protein BZG36_04326 [Bifiguratus adelaidae]|uniref:Arrestin-like N-terminal domain-containing protein n=1 Tax=Bifiguratus adelaidae TaxID=1938954 RepID=A0A261XV09_9FUNG|nr:hypothetical protein BZG36_04326 [Bifiguratus adelaidae]
MDKRMMLLVGEQGTHKLSAGTHRFLIEFPIPHSLPESMDIAHVARARYSIHAEADFWSPSLWPHTQPLRARRGVVLSRLPSDAFIHGDSPLQGTIYTKTIPGLGHYSISLERTTFAIDQPMQVALFFAPAGPGIYLETCESYVTERCVLRIPETGACRVLDRRIRLHILRDGARQASRQKKEDRVVARFPRMADNSVVTYNFDLITPDWRTDLHHSTLYPIAHIKHWIHMNIRVAMPLATPEYIRLVCPIHVLQDKSLLEFNVLPAYSPRSLSHPALTFDHKDPISSTSRSKIVRLLQAVLDPLFFRPRPNLIQLAFTRAHHTFRSLPHDLTSQFDAPPPHYEDVVNALIQEL